MAFAAFGIGVGVRVLSFGLASGGAAVILGHYGATTKSVTDKLTHWLSSKFKPTTTDINMNINDAVVGRDDKDSSNKSSSSCYLSQPELLRKMEEEEAADDGFITSGSKSDDHDPILKLFSPYHQQSELPTAAAAAAAAAAEKTDEEEAAAVVRPAAPVNLFTHVNMKDEDSGNKSSSSCYLSQQQPHLRNMEEAADDGFITSGLESDNQQSELLVLLSTAAAAKKREEKEAAAAVDPAAPLNLLTDINMKESSSSSWMRMKKKVSEIFGRVKSGVRRWKGEVVEWWCYLKGPDFWDGKKERILRDILWLVADHYLIDALTIRNKGALLSTVRLRTFVRQLYVIFKANVK